MHSSLPTSLQEDWIPVYYLLRPDMTVWFCDLTGRTVLDMGAKYPEVDLARLEWVPAERPFTDDLLHVALVKGVPCSTGVVVYAVDLVALEGGEELRALTRRSQAAKAKVNAQNGPLMEALIPGWTEGDRKLDAELAESMEQSARERDAERARALSEQRDPELVRHWLGI